MPHWGAAIHHEEPVVTEVDGRGIERLPVGELDPAPQGGGEGLSVGRYLIALRKPRDGVPPVGTVEPEERLAKVLFVGGPAYVVRDLRGQVIERLKLVSLDSHLW